MKKIIILLVLSISCMTLASCGKQKPDENNVTFAGLEVIEEDGLKYVYYGNYPQTIVNDSQIIAALSKLAVFNEQGYLEYNQQEYAVITTSDKQTQYFLVEPIKWLYLGIKDDAYQLITAAIIDQQEYIEEDNFTIIDHSYNIKPGVPAGTYANNYQYSDLREWLNNDFYLNAFVKSDKSIIVKTNVDNSANTTGHTPNPYACANTDDYVLTLSAREASTINGTAKPTDYAKAEGCDVFTYSAEDANSEKYVGNGYWWTRSPNYFYPYSASGINYNGLLYNYINAYYLGIGVRPVINIK